jgi:GNAT superfamily N-acetyltransferase
VIEQILRHLFRARDVRRDLGGTRERSVAGGNQWEYGSLESDLVSEDLDMKRRAQDIEDIGLVRSDEEIQRCFPVLNELRTQIQESEFVKTVRRLEREGFRLACVTEHDDVKAVAGFRVTENLDNGRFMYVDDLVTKPDERSRGYGQRLFAWLLDYARSHGCQALSLDSGVQRFDAHRFYLRNRMRISSHHFWMPVDRQRDRAKPT